MMASMRGGVGASGAGLARFTEGRNDDGEIE